MFILTDRQTIGWKDSDSSIIPPPPTSTFAFGIHGIMRTFNAF